MVVALSSVLDRWGLAGAMQSQEEDKMVVVMGLASAVDRWGLAGAL